MSATDSKTILLVEDEAIIAVHERKTLEKHGFKVIVAYSGEAAVSSARENPGIDLVLMDINLGKGMDGTEAARAILRDHDLPVIFLSSHTDRETVAKTEAISSYGYVVKMSGETILLASIEMAFKLFGANQRVKATKAELAASNETLQKVLDSIPQYICWKDRDLRFLGCNMNFARMAGFSDTRSLIGKTAMDLPRTGRGMDELLADDALAMEADTAKLHILKPSEDASGGEIWFDTSKVPLHDAEGRVNGLLVVFSDLKEPAPSEKAFVQEQYLLQSLMNTSSDYIYFKDREGHFLRASRAHARHLGLNDPSQMTGKTDFDFFSPDHAKRAYAEEEAIIATGSPVSLEEKDTLINRTETWVQTIKWPLRGLMGEIIGTFGISRDVTDRRQAEERVKSLLAEKEILLKEVRHRVKNNMSTICSLISLQAEAARDPAVVAALRDVGGRIQSVMLVYEKLGRSEEGSEAAVDEFLSPFVDEIVAGFPSGARVRVEKDIGGFALDTKAMQTLGMIVNELITNVMKYAFVGRGSGSISVSAALSGGLVRLAIRDNGVGMPESVGFEASSGLGLVLVGMLAKQLKGEIRVERREGTEVILEFERAPR